MSDDNVFQFPEPDKADVDPKRERMLEGMCCIIQRMTRHCGTSRETGASILCMSDYSDRELAACLLAFMEGKPTWIER